MFSYKKMNKNFIKLEYIEILKKLEKYCITYYGKNICKELKPSFKKSQVKYLLNQTSEAQDFLTKFGKAPIAEIPNITISIKNLESNYSLSAKALLEIGHILKISRELNDYFYKNISCNFISNQIEKNGDFTILNTLFENLYSNINLENIIFDSIIDENNISDNASKTLSMLRRKRRRLEDDIKNKLNSFIHSSSYSKYIMESIITIRDDRYVIPVKAEFKDNIHGLIHDISASGSTVFIEPMTIFEYNNQINNIKMEENLEIEKILEELTKRLFPIMENLKNSVIAIGEIDFCFAKAMFSNELDGIAPIINDKKIINLISARHPLIDKNVVVPIDISLGIDYNTLIITGPNTGGKTVTLKTTGLLCLMAYSGLHIPAKSNTTLYVFDNIFADIGDEQSIEESLSTFSSHMLNIIEILNRATSDSLILVDELGSGTDPLQGASLAISILEYFYNINAITLATTHYSELKTYALTHNGFENASSEFDIENLAPTYKLIIGVPGKSNAFAISKRLGLPQNILKRAEEFIDEDDISVEELIKNIYDDKLKVEKEKEEIEKNSNQIKLLRKSLERDNSKLELQANEIVQNAKNKAKDILFEAKEEADLIIKDLNKMNSSDDLKRANKLRNTLNEKIKESTNISKIEGNLTANDIKLGMDVLIINLNLLGTVISLPNKSDDVQIQVGNAKMNVKVNNLKVINSANTLKDKNIYSKVSTSTNLKSKSASTEINVIGQNVDEAIFVIDKFLDDCALSNLSIVRIVHGKGTGKLRDGIHKFLRTNPHVKSFRVGTFGEGEMGVTVVELK